MAENRRKIYQIVVYCSYCGKELTRSKEYSKKELKADWNFAITSAALYLRKCDCEGTKKAPLKFANTTIKFLISVRSPKKDGTYKEEIRNPKDIL